MTRRDEARRLEHQPAVGIQQFRFIGNADDNRHCFQASYRMAVQAQTCAVLDREEAEAETRWVDGMPTWPYAGILGLAERGVRITSVEYLDIPRFVEDAEGALAEMIGEREVLDEVLATTDLRKEQLAAANCLQHERVTMERRIPVIADIQKALTDGAVVICNVNARAFDGRAGYAPHFVLVSKQEGEDLVVQNPGLPPHENQRVSPKVFERGWYYPDRRLGNMIVAHAH